MNRKQKIIVSITGIVIVVLALLGLTYAYFVTQIQGNDNDKSIEVTTANLRLVYGDGNGTVTANNIIPGTVIDTKTFTVKNEGTATTRYAVYLENVVNTFTNTDDIKITMTCTSSDDKTCSGIDSSFPKYNDLLLSNNIDVGVTHTYSVTVEYLETNTDQSIDMNKTISGKFQIYNMNDVVVLTGTVTGASVGDYVELHSETKRSEILNNDYKIVGVNPGVHTLYVKDKDGNTLGSKTITVNKTSTESVVGNTFNVTDTTRAINVDINTIQTDLAVTSSIKFAKLKVDALVNFNDENNDYEGYEITKIVFTHSLDYETGDNLHDNTKYKLISTDDSTYPVYAWKKNGILYIGVEKGIIYANESSYFLFAYFNHLTTIEFNNMFDTSRVTNMNSMFDYIICENLDLSNFDTNKVTDMSSMFTNSNISNLDLSNFDTSKVTDMSWMFSNINISNLDLSNFDTSNVTDMSGMFYYVTMVNIDLSSFDTSKVTNMYDMFCGSSITTLDLSNFDTSNVTDMSWMFSNINISNLDLSNFDTSNVTNMDGMFNGSSITTLDLSSFDTSKVTNMSSMFDSSGLLDIYVKNDYELNRFKTMTNIEDTSIIKIKSS